MSTQVGMEDRPDQPLLSQKPSDIGLPRSRRRSSVSQNRQRAEGAAKLPHNSEDGHQAHHWLKNFLSVFAVCALGAMGWYVAFSVGIWRPTIEIPGDPTHDSLPAQILGYLSAVGLSLILEVSADMNSYFISGRVLEQNLNSDHNADLVQS